jgi:hypothetical protein
MREEVYTMTWTLKRQTLVTDPDRVVSAVFFDDVSARDALADLTLAHFDANRIAVAEPRSRAVGSLETEGKHSLFWRLRHTLERDSHTRPGSGQTNDVPAVDSVEPTFTHVDLVETLTSLGVAATTMHLLEDRMGPAGFLIMVDAEERNREAESILVRNRGMLRNAMASEPSADKLPVDGATTVTERRSASVAR